MRRSSEYSYRPAWWVPGPHLQTLWGKLFRHAPPLGTRRDVWTAPDGDVLEVHRLDAAPDRPRLLLLHGLEGSIHSHYVAGYFAQAAARGWGADLLVFRGCGDAPNSARRFYHSGETTDLAFVVDRIRMEFPAAPLVLAGISLGGNVLLKWLGEMRDALPAQVRAAATVSVPYDLERGARHISHGFSRMYEAHFMATLKRKAIAKLGRIPDLCDPIALQRAHTIYEFDDAVTASVHGFANAHTYYSESSALRWLTGIRCPTLLLSAADDPFLPAAVLDDVRAVACDNSSLELEFVTRGGHAGFVSGRVPWRPRYYAEWRTIDFLARHV